MVPEVAQSLILAGVRAVPEAGMTGNSMDFSKSDSHMSVMGALTSRWFTPLLFLA